jgi:hypothetical protein
MNGVTLDAGALIALDRNHRNVLVLLARARELGARVTVPATELAPTVRRPCAKRAKQVIVTSDPDDLARLDASATLVRICPPAWYFRRIRLLTKLDKGSFVLPAPEENGRPFVVLQPVMLGRLLRS